ncbi:hypothetical protein Dimus_029778 [Dionaea muscipula]
MPSKTKKQPPKTPSRLSKSGASPSPTVSSSSSISASTRGPNTDLVENELSSFIQEACRRFPSFTSERAVVGRVTGVESQSKGCRIWLSESSMVASSISPGSIVSVALAPSAKRFSDDVPLSSLTDEFSALFGVDLGERMVDRAGNYFVLATVFPSCKVLKSEVRLSSNLSYSIGSPAAGSFVFIHPILSGSTIGYEQKNGKLHGSDTNTVQLYDCKELYLELVSLLKVSMKDGSVGLPSSCYSGATCGEVEIDEFSSPKTPATYRSRPCSPRANTPSSVATKDSVFCLMDTNEGYFHSLDIRELLESRKLLQSCAASWLASRHLLFGNLVMVPVLSLLIVFRVVGAKRCFPNASYVEMTGTPVVTHDTDAIIIIDHETSVHIDLPLDSSSVTSIEGSLCQGEIKSMAAPSSTADNVIQLGGLWKEYSTLKDIILSSVKNPLSSLGLRTTKGVLIHGPPGTGKTSLALLCAHDSGINLFKVNGAEIFSQYHGESEQALHEIFKSASGALPALVFIDELDAIAPSRKEGGEDLSQRMVATLLNLMDGISRTDGLLVIAATNRLESIEPALRRPGRLDREIEIGVPSPDQRLDILLTVLSSMEHSLASQQIQQLATVTHGFVGADLVSLCNEAAMVCLRRYIKPGKSCNDIHFDNDENAGCVVSTSSAQSFSSTEVIFDCTNPAYPASLKTEGFAVAEEEESSLIVTFDDFEMARMRIRPSAMREVILEVPKVKWEDVGGQQEVKTQLMEAVEWPQKHEDAFERIGTRPPTGVLLFGPPGCSKTLMARAVASEAGLNFLAIKGPELFSKWVGESEKAVRSLFAKARANAPSIIFFDELDSLAVIRGRENDGVSVADRVMSQLLVELDGLHQRVNVTVIAATNRPDKIDPALLRPGRFDRLLYVGPPNEADRGDIFHIHLRKMPCSSSVDVVELARLTEGCTGADISLICREAAIQAIEENLEASEIKMEHLKVAIKQARPSEIHPYQGLSEKFQRLVYSGKKSDELRRETVSSQLKTWQWKKWIAQVIYRLPAILSWWKTSSVG